STEAPALGGASVMVGDRVVGTVTSGDWGHRVGMNLAYAFVDVDMPDAVEVDVLGQRVAAQVIPPSPYDPEFSRMRS
ncbi:MAG: glycine cleavage T C-terminal barrel domain-containing protein, partial [Pseudomonadota bacterium]